MNDFFRECRSLILERAQFLTERKKTGGFQFRDLSPVMYERLLDFTAGGKMIRGGLVILFSRLLSPPDDPGREAAAVDAALAMELFQSALLIHDDIMDRDLVRRGKPSFFQQYTLDLEAKKCRDARHLGEAAAVCGGDIALFFAFEILAGMACDPSLKAEMIQLFSREMTWVGMAQVADVLGGSAAAGSAFVLDDKAVHDLYRYKTGRYSFSLPMAAGALLAGVSGDVLERVIRSGESLGIVFQLKDDELDLFGEEAVTGKPVGTDLEEGKQTLQWLKLLNALEAEQPEKAAELRQKAGRGALPSGFADEVRSLMAIYQIPQEIRALQRDLTRRAESDWRTLPVQQPRWLAVLDQLAEFNLQREK